MLVDPDQFELVILNLAVNARDAMPEGGLLRIACSNVVRSEAPAGEFVRVSIIDNGEGMSPETVERAFEPFFTTKEVGKGTGLGLAQVYAFARQAGGLAWIESELGGGTAVHLDLPRSLSPADTTNHPAPESDAEEAPPPAGEGRRVLIVEDDESVARMVCGLLESHGYVCDRVACARDAIEASQRERYDLVFTDIVMPGGMSGIDLAREFRRLMPALPVLLTTGFTGRARIEPGEFQILYKPWTPDDLLNAIHRGMAAGQAASGAREKNPIRQQDAERST
ncbi:MAG TPA: ATP-binding protein [Hyphomonadaceae bacterium]|nr:ATP-binding protein [Hyphomonadaceae bacterium]